MFKKNEDGYIIDTYPETCRTVPGYKYLITVYEGALSEYSKEAFNAVLYYFKEKIGVKVTVDNLNNMEWLEAAKGKQITEVKNIAFIAFSEKSFSHAEEIKKKLLDDIPQSEKKVFDDCVNYSTVLTVCIENGDDYIHVELPYCTIEKIADRFCDISI